MSGSLSVLKFRIFGDYGHFGVRYATTSSPTHMVPPRHTVAGMIGAILGVDREKVSEVFNPPICKIGVAVDREISTLRLPIKRLKVKSRSFRSFLEVKEHNIVPYLMLRRPSYVIYFHHNDKNIMSKLQQSLERHECVYPPSLGMAKLLADFEYLGEVNLSPVMEEKEITTRCVFPLDYMKVNPSEDNRLVIERFALYLDSKRQGYLFHRVMVDTGGNYVKGWWSPNKFATAMEETGVNETCVLW